MPGKQLEQSVADLNEAVTQDAYQLLQNLQHREGKLFKWYLTLEVTFRQAKNPNIITDPPAYFNTREHYLGNTEEVLKNEMKVLVEKIDSYEQSGSGWIVDNFISLIVAISKIPNPLSSKKEEKLQCQNSMLQRHHWRPSRSS